MGRREEEECLVLILGNEEIYKEGWASEIFPHPPPTALTSQTLHSLTPLPKSRSMDVDETHNMYKRAVTMPKLNM